eukprot:TRINITY_DN90982_c0_g1_i1.p1 TRINITY_DN90982_c0_g1~~TRINITY_DN90982_c0_g1_i1.p1  ORF type:complete len:111 (-),score=31.96 TRINITY_DN90982_c0_g1_i1:57-389(-)
MLVWLSVLVSRSNHSASMGGSEGKFCADEKLESAAAESVAILTAPAAESVSVFNERSEEHGNTGTPLRPAGEEHDKTRPVEKEEQALRTMSMRQFLKESGAGNGFLRVLV